MIMMTSYINNHTKLIITSNKTGREDKGPYRVALLDTTGLWL